MSSKKSATNNFATMVAECTKNWNTITKAAEKKNKIYKDMGYGTKKNKK